jgi:hypothetical protein
LPTLCGCALRRQKTKGKEEGKKSGRHYGHKTKQDCTNKSRQGSKDKSCRPKTLHRACSRPCEPKGGKKEQRNNFLKNKRMHSQTLELLSFVFYYYFYFWEAHVVKKRALGGRIG